MELTIIYITSQVLTIAMYVTLAITYYMKDGVKILLLNILASALIGVAFLLISAYTGAIMSLIAIIRNIIFLFNKKNKDKNEETKTKDIITLSGIIGLIIIATILTYSGFMSLLSVLATLLFSYSVWQKNVVVYRILGIPTSLLWILYYIYVMSLFGVILESLVLFLIVYSVFTRTKTINQSR